MTDYDKNDSGNKPDMTDEISKPELYGGPSDPESPCNKRRYASGKHDYIWKEGTGFDDPAIKIEEEKQKRLNFIKYILDSSRTQIIADENGVRTVESSKLKAEDLLDFVMEGKKINPKEEDNEDKEKEEEKERNNQ